MDVLAFGVNGADLAEVGVALPFGVILLECNGDGGISTKTSNLRLCTSECRDRGVEEGARAGGIECEGSTCRDGCGCG